MIQKELHLFIIWEKGRSKQDEIAKDIEQNFSIIKCYEIEWTPNLVANNFTRFYGTHLPPNSFKEIECGTGRFLLFVVFDTHPVYEMRNTSRGQELVNTNLFDAKMRYREWTGGGHKIHATNNPQETNHDLTLLLGLNADDFISQHSQVATDNIELLKRNIVGATGWNSLQQLFYVLNNTVEYVMLRGKDEVVSNVFSNDHRDVDLFLTRKNYASAVFIINGTPACSTERPHFLITIDGYDYYIDMWARESYYFDWRWSSKMIERRKLENSLYVLSEEDDFYVLLYHCLIFKGTIAEDYLHKLEAYRDKRGLKGQTWEEILVDFLTQHNYDIVVPTDKSVKLHFQGKLTEVASKYGEPIKYLHSSDDDVCEFESATYEKKNSFVKVGTSFLIDNEITFLNQLNNYSFFPKIINTDVTKQGKKLIETSRMPGVDAISFFANPKHTHLKTIVSFIRQSISILLILNKHGIYHRDFTHSNILVSELDHNKCRVSLIDFGWAITDLQLPNCVHPKGLGNEYAAKDRYSDIYSFFVLINKLGFRKIPYIRIVKKRLAKTIKIEAKGANKNEIQQKLCKIKDLSLSIFDFIFW